MDLTYHKTGTLIKQKFQEFFLPTVLSSMAAVSACIPLNQVTYALAVLISIGSSGLIAIAAGKRDNDDANYIFTTVVTVSVFVGVIWALILIPNSYALSIFCLPPKI